MHQKPYLLACTRTLRACICKQAIGEGRNAHHHVVQNGLDADVVVGSSLIDMYAKCGSLEEAIHMFHRLPSKTIVTWGIMMSAYVQHGRGLSAVELFDEMERQGVHPDKVIHVCLLKASGSIKSFMHGMSAHALVLKYGLESDMVVGCVLVDMYAKCGNMESSRNTFDKMPTQNIVLWSTIISSYVQHGDGLSALALYKKMRLKGLKPNKFVMSSILKGCALLGDYTVGKQIHEEIGQLKLESDVVLGNALVDMYAKLGRLHEAYEIFATLPLPNLVSWGAIITGYVQHGCSDKAIELFMEMHEKSIEPNLVILSCILQACGNLGCLQSGKLVHDQILRNGAGQDVVVACSLVDMYAKCGGLADGCNLLSKIPKNIAAWGAMMSGCIEHGEPHAAMNLFGHFLQHGFEPNKVLCMCILKACGSIGSCDQAMLAHSIMVSLGGLEIDAVIGSSLVDMYMRCRALEDASQIFGQLQYPDVVTWGTMIIGHVQQGHDLFALQLFEDMQQAGIRPSNVIYPSVVKACGNVGALMHGRLIHDLISRNELKSDVAIENSLIEMYKNCGCIKDSQQVGNNIFRLPNHNSMGENIKFGQCMKVTIENGCFRSFNDAVTGSSSVHRMSENSSTFSPSVACALVLNAEHFNNMICNLGCVGSLSEANHLLQTMPVLPDDVGWTTLLTSCRAYGNTELGRHCYDQAVQAV